MDRSDQWMVNFYERVAAEAAKNKLFVDFHGSFKPAGLEYKYPNILSYEGVRGMEQMSGCIPNNSLYLPFLRNAVGPMDYTPGACSAISRRCIVPVVLIRVVLVHGHIRWHYLYYLRLGFR